MRTARSRGGGALRSAVRALAWYLRELTGEGDYDRYRQGHLRVHGTERPPLTRREFERLRWERRGESPGARCC